MSKSSSVFVVTSGFYQSVDGAYSSLDAVKDAVLSDILLDVMDGDKYLSRLDDLRITEWIDGETVNDFQVSCLGVDFGTYKLTNKSKFLDTLDLVCVTRF